MLFSPDRLLLLIMRLITSPLLIGSVVYRIRNDLKNKGATSQVKYIMLTAFLLELFQATIALLFLFDVIPESLDTPDISHGLGLNNLQTGAVVALGLYLVFYLYGQEKLLYLPAYMFGAIILYKIISGRDELFPWFIYVGGIFAITMMFFASIKMRENNAIGLSIFYLFLFGQIMITPILGGNWEILFIWNLITFGFGIIYALGLFKPFKEEVDENEPIEEDTTQQETKVVEAHQKLPKQEVI